MPTVFVCSDAEHAALTLKVTLTHEQMSRPTAALLGAFARAFNKRQGADLSANDFELASTAADGEAHWFFVRQREVEATEVPAERADADEWDSLPALETWTDALAQLADCDPGIPRAGTRELEAHELEALNYSLTIAHALRRLPRALRPRPAPGALAKLLVVGARDAQEGRMARCGALARVAALCPLSGGWEIVLVGPEMTDWRRPARGSDCARAPVTAVGGALHDVLQAGGGRARAVAGADAAVLFNSGIGTLLWPLVDAWLPTCAALLERRVPVLLT